MVYIKGGRLSAESSGYPQNKTKIIIHVIVPFHYDFLNLWFPLDDNGKLLDQLEKNVCFMLPLFLHSCVLNTQIPICI